MAPALRGVMPDSLANFFCSLSSILPASTKLVPASMSVMSRNKQVVEDLKNDKLVFHERIPLHSVKFLVDAMHTSPATFK